MAGLIGTDPPDGLTEAQALALTWALERAGYTVVFSPLAGGQRCTLTCGRWRLDLLGPTRTAALAAAVRVLRNRIASGAGAADACPRRRPRGMIPPVHVLP
jgi:hypothetical protein